MDVPPRRGYTDDVTPFDLGLESRKNGKSLTDCPYTTGTPESGEWRRGWLIASTSSRLTPLPERPQRPGKAT